MHHSHLRLFQSRVSGLFDSYKSDHLRASRPRKFQSRVSGLFDSYSVILISQNLSCAHCSTPTLSLVPTLRTSEAASEKSCKTHYAQLDAVSFYLFVPLAIAFIRLISRFANGNGFHAKRFTMPMSEKDIE